MSLADRVFYSLEGLWRLERRIGDEAVFKGAAAFTITGLDRRLYEERGKLVLNDGQAFRSGRKFIYERKDAGINILYEDPFRKGDVLHELEFAHDGIARHAHVCGRDHYDLSFAFQKETLAMDYIVSGPKKNYRMESRLRRFGFRSDL